MQSLFQVRFLKEKALILFFYFLLAALLSPHHKYYIHLADTFQYLTIAQDYSMGDFTEAINSYWNPLFSWLLTGFLKIGIEPFSAIQLLQIIIGAIALLGIFVLIPFKKENRILFLLLWLSFAILIISFALLMASPDLLLLTISIWYLISISDKHFYFNNKYSFLLFGLTDALLYFAKGAGFVFFLLSFSLINILFIIRKDSNIKKIASNYFSSIGIFLILSSFWIILISQKEGKLLFSSTPEYNFNLIGPVSNPSVLGELHHPFEWNGLIPPFQKNSLNAWEEPQKLTLKNWSPLHSEQEFFHYIKIILRNIWSLQSYYFGLDAGTVLLLGILFLWIYRRDEIKNILSNNIIPIIIAVSCTFPYIFVLVTERYIWINIVILGIIAISVFKELLLISKHISIAFLLMFTFLIAYKPAIEMLTFHDDYTNIFSEKESFEKYISGNTASVLTSDEIGGENYTKSTIINYLSHGKYFGMIPVPEQNKSMGNELKKYQIKYLLSWNDAYTISNSLYTEAVTFPKSGVKVYKLK
ncbi:MAG: hypothetical protein HY840_04810 [Bacteroidetes bacterium]|nr:hypothetical protein [Bacteroidota bacterium]